VAAALLLQDGMTGGRWTLRGVGNLTVWVRVSHWGLLPSLTKTRIIRLEESREEMDYSSFFRKS
jgi:hypothetical protein